MRQLLLAGCFLIAAHVQATFDLVLVTDRDQGVVHRYDGDTGVYLGNFGNGQLVGARGIDVDKDRQIAAIACDGPSIGTRGLVFYNYNTGMHLGGWYGTSGSDVERLPDGSFAMSTRLASSSKVQRYSFVSPGVITQNAVYNSGSESPYGAIGMSATGDLLSIRSGALGRWGYGGGSTIGSNSNPSISGPLFGAADFSYKHLIWAMRGDGAVLRVEEDGSISYTGAASSITQAADFAVAHQSFGYGVGMASGVTRLQKYQYFGNLQSGGFEAVGTGWSVTQVANPGGIAVVAAPEVETAWVLGAGLVLGMWRRKRNVLRRDLA